MRNKTLKKGAGLKISIVFLLSLVVGYTIAGLLRFLEEKERLDTLLLDGIGTIEFLFGESGRQSQLLVAMLATLFFVWFLSKMNLFEPKYEDAHGFGVHGSARFTAPREAANGVQFSKQNTFYPKDSEKTMGALANGLIVGRVPNKKQLLIIPNSTKIDNRNVYIVGSSGSGKGQSYVIPNLLNNKEETLIVTDPKGGATRS